MATRSLNALPGLNLATFLAGICIRAPEAGFIPILLFLLTTPNVPKPVKTTDLPPLRLWPTVLINDSTALLQVAFGSLDIFAICSINLALFMEILLNRLVLFSYLQLVTVVPRAGLEPAQGFPRRILSPLRLPLPPPRPVEAAPGFEPGIRVLQTLALPLGYAALSFIFLLIIQLVQLFP
jgi:hypothetical protein